MRIQAVEIRNYPPISQLKAEELSNIVVFAGPNGVGKTRLIRALLEVFQNPAGTTNVKLQIAATSESEKKVWESNVLDTSQPSDAQKLARTLRRGQKRGGWRSSAILYDSNRQFRTVAPVQWSWTFTDPMEEAVTWNLLFKPFVDRFQDTLQSLHRMLGRHRTEIAKKAIQLKQAGETHMDLDFADPLEKFKEVFELLLGPDVTGEF